VASHGVFYVNKLADLINYIVVFRTGFFTTVTKMHIIYKEVYPDASIRKYTSRSEITNRV